ncbi:hypothetical protein B4966_04965 [Rhodocyclaceae bacterium]|nr:hypothetical protein B4966_04965 [Rhodocyclaceae bacterium]
MIQERYGVRLTPQGVVKYLARRGFTPQKPLKRAHEQRPQAGGGRRSPPAKVGRIYPLCWGWIAITVEYIIDTPGPKRRDCSAPG